MTRLMWLTQTGEGHEILFVYNGDAYSQIGGGGGGTDEEGQMMD